MKKILQTTLVMLVGLFLISSCGSSVTTSKKGDADLDSYRTYAWLPSSSAIQNSQYDRQQFNETIAAEVNQQMRTKGYTLNIENPDLLVIVHPMFEDEADIMTDRLPSSYDYYSEGMYVDPYFDSFYYSEYNAIPRVVGPDIDEVRYSEGSFVIDLIDRKTNTVVWRGMAENIEPENFEAEVRENVDEIFNKFPS